MGKTLLGVLLACLLVGCSGAGADPTSDGGGPTVATAEPSTAEPDLPLAWGPTTSELQQAQELVADWDAEQLAGGLIVARYHGYDAEELGELVRDLHLAGVAVTSDNVVDADQVRELTAAVHGAARLDGRDHPPVVGVDQEGGVVSHLRGVATEFPSFATAGSAVEADAEQPGDPGRQAVQEAARTRRSAPARRPRTRRWPPRRPGRLCRDTARPGSSPPPSTSPGTAA